MSQSKFTVTWLALVATIILAVPICWGWVARAFQVVQAPEKIQALEHRVDDAEKNAVAQQQSLKDIKSDLIQIKDALGIPHRRTGREYIFNSDGSTNSINNPN